MPRNRRSAALAALAMLGIAVLSGCGKAQPGVAAYVGDQRYSETSVEQYVDEAEAAHIPASLGDVRRTVVAWMVLGELGRQALADLSVDVPPTDSAAISRELGLKPDSGLAKLYGDWRAALGALKDKVQPVKPTEKDLRQIYQTLQLDPSLSALTYEQVASQLRDNPAVAKAIGVRNELRAEAVEHKVVVNPLYRPLVIPFGPEELQVSLDIPLVLAIGDEAVQDITRATTGSNAGRDADAAER